MEGAHFAAGPWFTVRSVNDDWKELSKLWISNGDTDFRGRIEVRLRWDTPGGRSQRQDDGLSIELGNSVFDGAKSGEDK